MMPRLPAFLRRIAIAATLVAGVAACRDRTVLEAPGGPPRRAWIAQPLLCEATSAGTMSCQRDGASVRARTSQEAVARVRRTLAAERGQMHAVTLGADTARMLVTVSYPQYSAAQQSFAFSLSLENRMSQPLGSVDGRNSDEGGIRYFLEQPPITTQGTGLVQDSMATGTMTGPNGPTPYWQANDVVLPRQQGAYQYLVFRWPSTVKAATFRLMIVASLPDESEDGLLLRPNTWTQVALGDGFGCGLRTGGAVYCWGSNRTGSLADGMSEDVGVRSNFVSGNPTQVALGLRHGCAVVQGGRDIYCWGNGTFGQQADQYNSSGYVAVSFPVDTARRFAKVMAGDDHTCALTTAGALWCWGANTDGQLGFVADDDPHVQPRLIGGGWSGILEVTLGHNHSCVLASDRKVWCWGGNEHGQLQDGTTTSRFTPALVSDNRQYLSISSGGGATCGIANVDGNIYCWGDGSYGLRGTGANEGGITSAVLVSTVLPAFTSISVGAHHICAVGVTGDVACWGENTFGQIGLGTRTPLEGVLYPEMSFQVATVAVGTAHTCARSTTGQVQCWGANYWGQSDPSNTTTGTTDDRATVGLITTPTSLAVGGNTSCATFAVYGVQCWGDNASGQVSTYAAGRDRPAGIFMKSNVRQITAGNSHACALDVDGVIWCWGSHVFGQVGNGAATTRAITAPESLTTGDRYLSVKAGAWHTCAVRSADSSMVCWGDNTYGQLGIGTSGGAVTTPTPVAGNLKVTFVEAGGFHSCAQAFFPDGRVYCWGRNDRGQLGDGTTTHSSAPVLTPIVGYDQMALGDQHTCGRYSEGISVLLCWGDNRAQQLGIGGALDYETGPGQVFYGQIVSISAGPRHTCALLTVNNDIVQSSTFNFQNGDESLLYCWGANDRWEAGDNARSVIRTFDEQSPYQNAPLSRALFGGAASSGTCLLARFSQAYCWGGDNATGQMGSDNGRYVNRVPSEGPIP